jgi:hypothetical protein
MFRQLFRRLTARNRSLRSDPRVRHATRFSGLEGLEDRRLLSGNPTVYTVTDASGSTGDTGSLPYAIREANFNTNPAGSVIEFESPFFSVSRTITLSSTLVLSGTAGPETIEGPGANLLTISGNHRVEVLRVATNSTTASLSGVTIAAGAAKYGGGIYNDGTLTVSDCIISGNSASGSGEGGGGIFNNGPALTVTGSLITGNYATDSGGGVDNEDTTTMSHCVVSANTAQNGAGVFNDTNLTMTACSITGNSTINLGEGGGIYNKNALAVIDSTIARNSSAYSGGVFNDGAATFVDSTIADNYAGLIVGGITDAGSLTAVNVTVSGNSSRLGSTAAGLDADGGVVTLENTIVAQNTAAGFASDFMVIDGSGATVSAQSAYNLFGTGGSGGLVNGVNGNQVGVANPGLGPLANNGGPTQTVALLPGSPAIGAGSTALDDGQLTDQRGGSLARVYNGKVDIGAYEVQPATVVATAVSWGTETTALQTAADGLRLLPAGRSTDLPWLGIDSLAITLDEPETLSAADVTIMGMRGMNYGPASITGSGTTYTITFARPIEKADRVMISIAGAGINSFTRRLDVLPGDFYDSGVVNGKDITAIHNEWKRAQGAQPTIFGEVLGDGTVTAADYKAARKFNRVRLPKMARTGATPPKTVLVRSLAHQHHDFEGRR